MSETKVSEMGAQLQAELLDMIQEREGDNAVLEEAEACEQIVREVYDEALAYTDNAAIEDVLSRQREKVDFGESVVREVRSSDQKESS